MAHKSKIWDYFPVNETNFLNEILNGIPKTRLYKHIIFTIRVAESMESKKMQISSYEVGKKYPGIIGNRDEVKFDLTDGGAIIPIYMRKPTANEVSQLSEGTSVKMAYVARNNVLIMLFKFGDLNWMDAPYTPHLSKNLTHLPDAVLPDEGLAAHLILFDTSNGELMTQRLFSLRSKLSNDLIREIGKMMEKPFDLEAYKSDIAAAYRYSTDELVKQSKIIYRVQ